MTTLIEISRDLIELESQLEELEDSPGEQDEAIAQWIKSFDGTIAQRDLKLDNYAGLIGEIQHRVDIRKAEAKRLQDRAAIDENKVKVLKHNLQQFFEAHQLKTIETNRYKLTLAKNGGKLPVILDSRPVEQLPERYRQTQTVTTADREAIRKALEAGEILEFARLGDRGQSLRIK